MITVLKMCEINIRSFWKILAFCSPERAGLWRIYYLIVYVAGNKSIRRDATIDPNHYRPNILIPGGPQEYPARASLISFLFPGEFRSHILCFIHGNRTVPGVRAVK